MGAKQGQEKRTISLSKLVLNLAFIVYNLSMYVRKLRTTHNFQGIQRLDN